MAAVDFRGGYPLCLFDEAWVEVNFFRITARTVQIVLLLSSMLVAWLYARSGLRRLVWLVFFPKKEYEPLENPRILRLAFESLGPSFIKLGQVIASSPGLFPKRYSDEFAHCLDRVKPFPTAQLKAFVERECGRPLEVIFESFDDTPLGSASIAQVHAATMSGGGAVVVKVQRPNIAKKVDADLFWMRLGAKVAELLFRGARLANVRGVIADFDRTIHEEIDFRKEAQNMREFNALMGKYGISDVMAPEPIEGLVTTRVLVMTRFFGLKADDKEGILAAGIDPGLYLRKGLRAWLMTTVLDGFFHGDAHAGNLMMLPEACKNEDGSLSPAVGLLDFGIIGRFDLERRHQVIRYVLAFAIGDYSTLADVMLEMGAIGKEVDRTELIHDLKEVYEPLISKRLEDLKYEDILPSISALVQRHGIRLPSEFLLTLKQLLFFDRYAKLMAPDLNVFSDFHLVDFLFSPVAVTSGLDFNILFPLLKRVQEVFAERGVSFVKN